ncbi:lytic transglycosylase domain-containing protein [Candidatus Latescibacterota bacterium]
MKIKHNLPIIIMIHRLFLITFNLCLVLAGFIILDHDKVVSHETKESAEMTRAASLPFRPLTREEKTRMFFEELRIDTSHLKLRTVRESLEPWQSFISRYSSQYDVDPYLMSAILYAESKGDPYRISRDGALGLMQIMPSTADFLGFDNVLEPEENIRAGAKYISMLMDRYELTHTLWAWNAGPSRVQRRHLPGETRKFIVEVLTVKSFLEEIISIDNVS